MCLCATTNVSIWCVYELVRGSLFVCINLGAYVFDVHIVVIYFSECR